MQSTAETEAHSIEFSCPLCGEGLLITSFNKMVGEDQQEIRVTCDRCSTTVGVHAKQVNDSGGDQWYEITFGVRKPWSLGFHSELPDDLTDLDTVDPGIVYCPYCGDEAFDLDLPPEAMLPATDNDIDEETVDVTFECSKRGLSLQIRRDDWTERGARGIVDYTLVLTQ